MKRSALAALSTALFVFAAYALPILQPMSYFGGAVSAFFDPLAERTAVDPGDRKEREPQTLAPQATYFSQDFSSSTVVASYASSTPNSGQFNSIVAGGEGMTVSINGGRLQFVRNGSSGYFTRSTDFSPTPATLKYSFEITVSGNLVAQSSAAYFQVGSNFSPTRNATESDANTYSRFSVNWTNVNGQFSIRNLGTSTNSSNFTGTNTVTWFLNNSGSTITYVAPNGAIESLANDRGDIWVGASKAFDEHTATTTTQSISDLKFAFVGGAGTIQLDNILIEDIPPVPPLADYTILQFPSSTSTNSGQATGQIYGRISEAGVTEIPGASASVTAELGYGPLGSDPRTSPSWTYLPAAFNTQIGNDDEYVATINPGFPPSTTQYAYTYRFSLDGGTNWTYADLDGNGTNSGLTFDPAQLGTLTVNYVAPQPGVVNFDPVTYSPNESDGSVTVTVKRTGGTDGTVTVDYGTNIVGFHQTSAPGGPNPATGGAACDVGVDYIETSGTLTFLDGDDTETFSIPICNDGLYENTENLFAGLANATGGAAIGPNNIATVNIQDDDIPSVEFAAASYAKREGSTASLVITRTGATNAAATVDYSVSGGNATAGTCGTAGVDYVAPGGSVEFAIGETEKTVGIQLCTDSLAEDPNETIELTIDSAVGAEVGSPATTTLTILDGLLRSLWVFGGSLTPNPVSDATGRSTLIARSGFAGISELYVSVYQGDEDDESGRRMYPDADMAALNGLADAGGQEVWAAYGDTDWPALTAGCPGTSFPELRMAEVVAFNASRPANERFDGVMLDVESAPDTEEEFQALLAHYECMRSRLPGDIKLGVAISAFWDDDVIEYPVIVSTAVAAPKSAAFHIIDLPLDRVVVMGYRDHAGVSGGNGIIGLDEDEIAYSNSVGKTGLIFAGLETISLPGEDNVTFREEGQAVMEVEAGIVADFFDASLGLGGFSIHNYGASYLSGDALWPAGPTAAPASIAGRVMTANGGGIRGVVVMVQGMDGVTRSVTTNTFGHYRIEGLTAGESYVVSVSSRRYSFPNGTQFVNLDDNVSGLDFTASP